MALEHQPMLMTAQCPCATADSDLGDRCRADQLYDPAVPLFKGIFKHRPEVFPSEDFSTTQWLEVGALFLSQSACLPFHMTC